MDRVIKIIVELTIASFIVCMVWVFQFKLPQGNIGQMKNTYAESLPLNGKDKGAVLKNNTDLRMKFQDKFSDQIISTDMMYKSPDISVTLSKHQIETGVLDASEGGKHKRYGTKIAYTVADIYVADMRCLQTAFAQDTYGVGYEEKLTDMSKRLQSILAINGDSYSNNRHKDNGTIIRNGKVYRSKQSDVETCVLNMDGTMDIYGPNQVDLKHLQEKGAYQSWVFGPSLLGEYGKAKRDFLTWDYIKESHPRTAIGYYEPGHYCFLQVDGRQNQTRGMFLEEMAKIFEDLGCQKAYNLDGGHCSFMTKGDKVVNHPYKAEHTVQDGIFIQEAAQ